MIGSLNSKCRSPRHNLPQSLFSVFYLSDQEKAVAVTLIAIMCFGAIVHYAKTRNMASSQWMSHAYSARKPKPFNLNSASEQQLNRLPFIGPNTSKKIIEYRTKHGFIICADIQHIPKISKKAKQTLLQACLGQGDGESYKLK